MNKKLLAILPIALLIYTLIGAGSIVANSNSVNKAVERKCNYDVQQTGNVTLSADSDCIYDEQEDDGTHNTWYGWSFNSDSKNYSVAKYSYIDIVVTGLLTTFSAGTLFNASRSSTTKPKTDNGESKEA